MLNSICGRLGVAGNKEIQLVCVFIPTAICVSGGTGLKKLTLGKNGSPAGLVAIALWGLHFGHAHMYRSSNATFFNRKWIMNLD